MKTIRLILIGAMLVAGSSVASAEVVLDEGFNDINTLNDWYAAYNSTPGGETGWFQGDNTSAFSASSGPANSYIAANFANAPYGGNVDTWLITPELSLLSHTEISFDTRTAGNFPGDNLALYINDSADTLDFGAFQFVGALGSYPTDWTTFFAAFDGIGSTARFAFRYTVTDTSVNGDYIGIDNVRVTSVPEPGTLALFALVLLAVPMAARRRRSQA
jgi:hypothetical protein